MTLDEVLMLRNYNESFCYHDDKVVLYVLMSNLMTTMTTTSVDIQIYFVISFSFFSTLDWTMYMLWCGLYKTWRIVKVVW